MFERSLLFALVFFAHSFSEIIYRPLPIVGNKWDVDSLFIGVNPIVKNSAEPVKIRLKWNQDYCAKGSLFYMFPFIKDSSVYLFDNNQFAPPADSNFLTIGQFCAGTQLYFKYHINDTFFIRSNNKDMLTGQNRVGIDEYISDFEISKENGGLGKLWAVGGRIDSTRIEIGFSTGEDYSFRSMVFEITNVYLGGLEKNKIPVPYCSKNDSTFIEETKLTITVPEEGLKTYISYPAYSQYPPDTVIDPIKNGATCKIYYTTDGSTPTTSSNVYTDSITLTSTTTIKAFAHIEGDTNWFDSEIMTRTFTKEPSTFVKKPFYVAGYGKSVAMVSNRVVYDICGRKMGTKDIRNNCSRVLLDKSYNGRIGKRVVMR